jgi:hypothetical protein
MNVDDERIAKVAQARTGIFKEIVGPNYSRRSKIS